MKRTIYSNYDLTTDYSDEYLKETALECGWVDEDEEITDDMLWDWRYDEDRDNFDAVWTELTDFFADKLVVFMGIVGRWTGPRECGAVGDFAHLYNEAIRDCDYVKFEDENGHLYLTCSHHDGTNHFEIRVVNAKGEDYYDRRNCEKYTHETLFKKYSVRPQFFKKVYGV